MADRHDVLAYCNTVLRSGDYQDVAWNGLQVEGSERIERIATAVSASACSLTAAAEWNADVLLVHHGLFWGSSRQPLTGMLANRIRLLFQSNMNLIAYHLPLDGHAEIGNCALLARELGFQPTDRFAIAGSQPLGIVGSRSNGYPIAELVSQIKMKLQRNPTIINAPPANVTLSRVGFVTGSGYSTISDAVAAGCEALVTGDVREPTMAEAREQGITVIAAGHEATERLGVQALADQLASEFSVETRFFHDPNPV